MACTWKGKPGVEAKPVIPIFLSRSSNVSDDQLESPPLCAIRWPAWGNQFTPAVFAAAQFMYWFPKESVKPFVPACLHLSVVAGAGLGSASNGLVASSSVAGLMMLFG